MKTYQFILVFCVLFSVHGAENQPENTSVRNATECLLDHTNCDYVVTDTVYVVSNGTVDLPFNDTEWQNARSCLLNHTGCDQVLSNFLNTLSNGTLDLPLNVADWTLNCLVNDTNCGKLLSSFLRYLSSGGLDLQLDDDYLSEVDACFTGTDGAKWSDEVKTKTVAIINDVVSYIYGNSNVQEKVESLLNCADNSVDNEQGDCLNIAGGVFWVLTNGKIDIEITDLDIKDMKAFSFNLNTCLITGQKKFCQYFAEDVFWFTLYKMSNGKINLSQKDVNQGFLAVQCLMGGKYTAQCQGIHQYFSTKMMIAVGSFSQKYPTAIYECAYYGKDCVQTTNDFILMASNGVIDLKLKEWLTDAEFNSMKDCAMIKRGCDEANESFMRLLSNTFQLKESEKACLMTGEMCEQIINDFISWATNGREDILLKESDFEELSQLQKLAVDCSRNKGKSCDRFSDRLFGKMLYFFYRHANTFTAWYFPELSLGGGLLQEDDFLSDPEVILTIKCGINDVGKDCIQSINNVVRLAMDGTIKLKRIGTDLKAILELQRLVTDCAMEKSNCDEYRHRKLMYESYVVSKNKVIDDIELSPAEEKAYKEMEEYRSDSLKVMNKCFKQGEGCGQTSTNVVEVLSKGKIYIQLKDSDLKKITEMKGLMMDCLSDRENCEKFVRTFIRHTAKIFTRGTIDLTEEDPEVNMIAQCLMNDQECIQVINKVVLMASKGKKDIQLKDGGEGVEVQCEVNVPSSTVLDSESQCNDDALDKDIDGAEDTMDQCINECNLKAEEPFHEENDIPDQSTENSLTSAEKADESEEIN